MEEVNNFNQQPPVEPTPPVPPIPQATPVPPIPSAPPAPSIPMAPSIPPAHQMMGMGSMPVAPVAATGASTFLQSFIAILILLVGGGSMYFAFTKNNTLSSKDDQNLPASVGQEQESTINTDADINTNANINIDTSQNSEISTNEIFKNQPGGIKSIKVEENNKWILEIDLLSSNPKWLPGVDSTGGFFINQNAKIRNLNITTDTKAYRCDGSQSTASTQVSSFISDIQNTMIKAKTDSGILGEFGYTAYFDISGDNITAIYEQCLP